MIQQLIKTSASLIAKENEVALWQTLAFENFTVRYHEYAKDYKAEGWCRSDRVMLCLNGEMVLEFADGNIQFLSKGKKIQIAEQDGLYKCRSKEGAKVLIVEGKFLTARKSIERNPWRM